MTSDCRAGRAGGASVISRLSRLKTVYRRHFHGVWRCSHFVIVSFFLNHGRYNTAQKSSMIASIIHSKIYGYDGYYRYYKKGMSD